MNTANVTAKTAKLNVTRAPCWKCWGARRFNAFSHVAGGVCFACGGTGITDVRTYVDGLSTQHGEVSYWFGKHMGGLTMWSPSDGPWGGLIQMPRAKALECIHNTLTCLKKGANHPEIATLEAAIRLASVGEARVTERAIAFLGGDLGAQLRAVMPGAEAIVARTKELAAQLAR